MTEDFERLHIGGVVVISVHLSRATLNEAQELKTFIEEARIIGHKKIVVDISECESIDSTFIGALVYESKKISALSGNIKIVQPANAQQNLLAAPNILRVFDLYETREEAVNSFSNS